jgi:hypothetical protein
MTPEGASWGKLTELMPDHLLSHIDRHMLATVVDRNGVTNHLGNESWMPVTRS